jgi:Spy/CpxP family protein refolding chaperone
MPKETNMIDRHWLCLIVAGLFAVPGTTQEAPTADSLRQEIHFLQVCLSLELTAAQRAQAADALEAFHDKRGAIEKLAGPPEFVRALQAVRDALIAGKEPSPEMRAAVEQAQPQGGESLERAFMEARNEVLAALQAVLTPEQQTQLKLMPLVGLANELLQMCLESQRVGGEEGTAMRLQAFPEIREQLGAAGGEAALDDFQGLVNRIAALTPEQVDAQRPDLVGQVVGLIQGTLEAEPARAEGRLRDLLWGWMENPRIGGLLRESAEAMGGG